MSQACGARLRGRAQRLTREMSIFAEFPGRIAKVGTLQSRITAAAVLSGWFRCPRVPITTQRQCRREASDRITRAGSPCNVRKRARTPACRSGQVTS